MEDRRIRTYYIQERFALAVLQMRRSEDYDYIEIVDESLPDDAKVVRVWYDTCRQAWGTHVHSNSFDEVPDCERPPEIIAEGFRIVKMKSEENTCNTDST